MSRSIRVGSFEVLDNFILLQRNCKINTCYIYMQTEVLHKIFNKWWIINFSVPLGRLIAKKNGMLSFALYSQIHNEVLDDQCQNLDNSELASLWYFQML